MKTKKRKRGLFFLLAVLAAAACLLTGCGAQKSEAQEDAGDHSGLSVEHHAV